MSANCDICDSQPRKYKCPTLNCPVQYCSMSCFKNHRSDHKKEDPKQISGAMPEAAAAAEASQPMSSDAPAPPQPADPMAALLTHPEYLRLFMKHPQLRSQLRHIHDATKEQNWRPSDRKQLQQHPRWPARGRNLGRFTQEKADAHAITVMRGMGRLEKDGEGLREFQELVKMVFDEREGEAEGEAGMNSPEPLSAST